MSLIKASPEDFVVEEIPAYEPSGEGQHVFVRFKKRDMTTDAAVRAIARALGTDARHAGIAGMKDKRAITTQTISLEPPRGMTPAELVTHASALALPDIEVLDVRLHGNKLKTGHLHGNRFVIRVRKLSPVAASDLATRAAEIAVTGVPNAFGEQRFGTAHRGGGVIEKTGDNATRARAIVTKKEPMPRDSRLLRLLYSALQSDVFNAVLDERVKRKTWATALLGDVLKKTETGGLFVCTDEQEDRARAATGEISATGPIFGPKMMRAEHEVGALELEIARDRLGDAFDATMAGELGEGTRRALRLFVSDCKATVERPSYNTDAVANDQEETSCLMEFVLPKGAFATTVIAHLTGTKAE